MANKKVGNFDEVDLTELRVSDSPSTPLKIVNKLYSIAGRLYWGNSRLDAQTPDISGKVDKVIGKGLSTNDYTTEEKNKLANIPPTGIKGDKGDKGDTGLQGGKGDKGDKGDTGSQGTKGDQGLKGDKGNDGYTPQKGVDYFDGNDGHTPVKGVDYVDGIDGKQLEIQTTDTYIQTRLTGGTWANLIALLSLKGDRGDTVYVGNIDGGNASSVYGGQIIIDGGHA